ncbi:hypothetical protein D3C87_1362850 [compost metagenome]
MHLFERIEAAKQSYYFERRAGVRYAKPYFDGVFQSAIVLMSDFSVLLEKVRLGEVPANPAYQEHVDTAVEALRRLHPFLGLSGIDLFAYSRQAIDDKVKPYRQQFIRRQHDVIREANWLLTQESQKIKKADQDKLVNLARRVLIAEAKVKLARS